MHKVGENETKSDYSDEDSSDSEENGDNDATTNRQRPNFNGFNYQSNYQNNQYPNQMFGNNNWNTQNSQNNFGGIQRAYNGQLSNQNYSDSRTRSNDMNEKNNQTEQDRACLVHCFFHELKMVKTSCFLFNWPTDSVNMYIFFSHRFRQTMKTSQINEKWCKLSPRTFGKKKCGNFMLTQFKVFNTFGK